MSLCTSGKVCGVPARRFSAHLVLFLIILGSTTLVSAQRWDSFTTANGMPGNAVTALLTDRDGRVWVATNSGVGVYDGIWRTFRGEQGLTGDFATSLAEDADGHIWIGTSSGITRIDPASFDDPRSLRQYTTITTGGGLPENFVTSIAIAPDGLLWFGTSSAGIAIADPMPDPASPESDPLLRSDRWQRELSRTGLTFDSVFKLANGPGSEIWTITRSANNALGDLQYKRPGEAWQRLELPGGPLLAASALLRDREGNMWIGTGVFSGGAGIFRIPPVRPATITAQYTVSEGLASDNIRALYQDRQGMLWAGHVTAGVSAGNPTVDLTSPRNWRRITTDDGLGSDNLAEITQDGEESLWFGHPGVNGASRLDATWTSILVERNTRTKILLAEPVDRYLWVATRDGAARIDLDASAPLLENSLVQIGPADGLPGLPVFDLLRDSDNTYWFATLNGLGRVPVDQLADPGAWRVLNRAAGFPFNTVLAAVEDDQRALWVTSESGLFKAPIDDALSAESWLPLTIAQGLPSNLVGEALIFTDRGGIWVGTDRGVATIASDADATQPQNWQTFDTGNGIAGNIVTALYEDSSLNIWVATQDGVSRGDPTRDLQLPQNWQTFRAGGPGSELAIDFVTAVAQSAPGEYWFGTSIAANRYNELALIPDRRWETFTRADGLLQNHISSIYTDLPTGDIWLGTIDGGITRYRPKMRAPETFLVESFDVVQQDRVDYRFFGADALTPREQLRYQYRVDSNNEADWLETGEESVTVFLEDTTNSDRAVRHVFEVRTIDTDGNVDPSPRRDVVYRLRTGFGGTFEVADSIRRTVARLYLPPHNDRMAASPRLQPLASADLPTGALAGFDLLPKTLELARTATLTIGVADPVAGEVVLYLLGPGESPIRLGGTPRRAGDSLLVTTAIKSGGRFYLAPDTPAADQPGLQSIDLQPRVIHPGNPQRSFGAVSNLAFTLGAAATATVKVYSTAGRLVRTIADARMFPQGTNVLTWDGLDRDGRVCPGGLYIVAVESGNMTRTQSILVSNR